NLPAQEQPAGVRLYSGEMLDVYLLGEGGTMPLPGRWLSSLLVRHEGRLLLFDCGEGTQIPLRAAGWGLRAVDAVFLTHFHADHVSGLPGLLLPPGNAAPPPPLWGRLQRGETVSWNAQTVEPDAVLGAPRAGLKLAFVTDTRPIPTLSEFVAGAQLLVCEGMYGAREDLPRVVETRHMLFEE